MLEAREKIIIVASVFIGLCILAIYSLLQNTMITNMGYNGTDGADGMDGINGTNAFNITYNITNNITNNITTPFIYSNYLNQNLNTSNAPTFTDISLSDALAVLSFIDTSANEDDFSMFSNTDILEIYSTNDNRYILAIGGNTSISGRNNIGMGGLPTTNSKLTIHGNLNITGKVYNKNLGNISGYVCYNVTTTEIYSNSAGCP